MKIAVFGANGGIGSFVVSKALRKGYEVRAYASSLKDTCNNERNLKVFEGSVYEYDNIKRTIDGCDAVIIALGVSMKWGVTDVDAIEARKNIIKAMKETKVNRLIDWSTPNVKSFRDKLSLNAVMYRLMHSLIIPAAAKKVLHEINKLIVNSNLDWTVVRFTAPKDIYFEHDIEAGFGDKKMSFDVSKEDIAKFMVDAVEHNSYIHSMPIIGTI